METFTLNDSHFIDKSTYFGFNQRFHGKSLTRHLMFFDKLE